MRVAKSIIILGLAFLLASFIPGRSLDYQNLMISGHYESFMVNGAGNVFVQVSNTENKNISLYVLSYNDTLVLVSEDSLENTTPLFQKEDFVNFSSIIALPERGWYGIVVATNSVNPSIDKTFIDIHINRPTPYLVPFLLFITSEVLGLGVFIYGKLTKGSSAR